jgi:N-methylhydantoinase B
MYDRTKFPAQGFSGGENGALGDFFLSDGTHPHPKAQYHLQPGQKVTLRLPGGGGFFSSFERDPELVRQDVLNGYVTRRAAQTQYGVVLTDSLDIDWATTTQLRGHRQL